MFDFNLCSVSFSIILVLYAVLLTGLSVAVWLHVIKDVNNWRKDRIYNNWRR